MRIIIANQDKSFRLALQLYFQTQDEMEVIAEISRAGELLRDAVTMSPDLILLDWNLPEMEKFSRSAHLSNKEGVPTNNQIKAIVISSLKHSQSNPRIIVTDNHPESLVQALYAGADGFLYQGEMPSRSITTLQALIKSFN